MIPSLLFSTALGRRLRLLPLGTLLLSLLGAPAQAQGDPLPSWRKGPIKTSLLRFVARVSRSLPGHGSAGAGRSGG